MVYSSDDPTIDILFFGDMVGRPGRRALAWYIEQLPSAQRPDLIIANVENASHGFGLSEKNYLELDEVGVDVMTSGNHIWDRKEILEYIERAPKLIRPANFAKTSPGKGWTVVTVGDTKVAVINVIGQVFMGAYNSPWEILDEVVPQLRDETPVIFLDIHAEATAEKLALARYASTLGVSAVVGTHTHVQTADDRIINHRTGYISDAGFCGSYDSIIGFVPASSIQRLRTQTPSRIEVS